MKNRIALFWLFFKARAASRSFMALSLLLITLTVGFSLLCPQPAPSSAAVGLIYDDSDTELSALCQQLCDLEEVSFIRYIKEQDMCRDIISGKLHCGYRIDRGQKSPIKVFETEASFLTPALDELVFSCWFEADMLTNAADLYKNGAHTELISKAITQSRLESKPFSVNITVNADVSGGEYRSHSLLPIVYSVIIPLFLLCCCFFSMLASDSESDLAELLAKRGGKGRIFISRFSAHLALFLLLFLTCEAIISVFVLQNSFSAIARFICAFLLAFFGALLFELFSWIKATSAVLSVVIMWSIFSVIFSGAFISPSLFGGLEPLKYISPSWLLLRLMTAVTAL